VRVFGPDVTPPIITSHVGGTWGANGWHTSNVVISWTVVDPESSIASIRCGTTQLTTDTAGLTLTCAATTTASPSPTNGWNDGPVVVSFSGSDEESGIASCSTSVVLGSKGAAQSASGTCIDSAGNTSATATAAGINIDFTPPERPTCGGFDVTVDLSKGDVPTEGDCVIRGTSGPDSINGLGGDDTICSLQGNDMIDGGDGFDKVFAGQGDDK
jgi:Ca2+-binding RTX toxin-like protein